MTSPAAARRPLPTWERLMLVFFAARLFAARLVTASLVAARLVATRLFAARLFAAPLFSDLNFATEATR